MPKPRAIAGYRSEIAAAVHETVQGLDAAGLVSKRTMAAFDASCLVPASARNPAVEPGRVGPLPRR